MKAKYRVADVLDFKAGHLKMLCANSWQYRTLQAVRRCRTMAMGGHIDRCDCCNKLHISYNSCRNRHCPTCQGHKQQEWIEARSSELLQVPYFHLVFTLPAALNKVCLHHPKEVYATLFKASWDTLRQFGDNAKHLGARMGMIAVLHTWGQNLSLHPHLHCIVPGGGVTPACNWKSARNKGKFLFNVKSMSTVYRAKYVKYLRKALPELPQSLYDTLFKKQWVVYAKRPFGRPQHVIEYLGRYTHKIAISNHRILDIDKDQGKVTFDVKNYRKGGQKTTMTLDVEEFIRRFSQHILPKGFTRIRHYGILSGTWKCKHLKELQEKLQQKPHLNDTEKTDSLIRKCPYCKKGTMVTILTFGNRGPPDKYKKLLKQNGIVL